jgi:uncharacterized membrane protein YfcA
MGIALPCGWLENFSFYCDHATMSFMTATEIYQSLTLIIFSLLAPVVTFGGGLIVSNALTITGTGLITAVGVTIFYFFLNGVIVIAMFRGHVIWKEVRNFLPFATAGSMFGAFFLSYINSSALLLLMFFFAIKFLYEATRKEKIKEKETKLSAWLVGLFSGFLASAALPGGGLRNSFMLSRGYSLSEVYSTTQIIGLIGWATNIVILFQKKILTIPLLYPVFFTIPFLIVINFFLQKGLLSVPKTTAKRVSVFMILAFTIYSGFILIRPLLNSL